MTVIGKLVIIIGRDLNLTLRLVTGVTGVSCFTRTQSVLSFFELLELRLPLAVTVVQWLRVSEGPGPSRISPQVRLVEGPSQLESTPLE